MKSRVPLAGLANRLQDLGVRRVRSLKGLKATKTAAFLEGAGLQIAGHFRPDAGLFVVDPVLETVGLVFGIEGAPDVVQEEVSRCLERGSYLRHILLSDPQRRADLAEERNTRAYTVEVVLSVCGSGLVQMAVHRALLRIARDSELLQMVGVGLLYRATSTEEFSNEALRQAFCWLLRDTKGWLQAPESSFQTKRLNGLEVGNYRLPGRRALELAPATRLHLIHGLNGTGKSSLVEALEFFATKEIVRLRGMKIENYYGVLANTEGLPVDVQVEIDGRIESLSLSKESQTLASGVSSVAESFRLDQPLMDRLVLPQNRDVRGATILRAFFPGSSEILKAYATALQQADKIMADLPEEVRSQVVRESDRTLEMERLFGWIEKDDEEVPREIVDLVLPVRIAALEPLAGISPDLFSFLEAWKAPNLRSADAKALLPRLDAALKQIAEADRQILETALITLERLAGWFVEDDQESALKDFREVLDECLETRALRDLLEREAQIVRALGRAEGGGWSRDPAFRRATLDESERDRYLGELGERQVRALRQLAAHESGAKLGAEGARQPSTVPPRVSREELTALEVAETWLGESALATAIRDAVADGKQVVVGSLTIGRRGWADALLMRLRALCESVSALPTGASTEEVGLRGRIPIFEQALKVHRDLKEASKRQGETFLLRVLGNLTLANAINELMALFTPARWAYEHVGLSHSVDARGEHDVRFKTIGDKDIDLRFNTAELNVFIVSLFLLCAPRCENPLGTLILDDPLQNMDELTVTAVARGLGKLSRLFPEGLQAILLFHGEDDLDRFRREVPAAVYRLPWLSPIDLSKEGEATRIEIDKLASSHELKAQDVFSILEDSEPS